MRSPSSRLLPLCAGLAAVAALVSSGFVRAQPAPSQRLTFTQPADGIVRLEASYQNTPGETCTTKIRRPLRSRLRGQIEFVQTSDGRLSIIDTLTFSEYLQGLAEVPRSWPQAALEAQVIAARSYALYHVANPRASGRSLGYDICATDACQVYRGAAVEQGAFGEQWVDAVQSTRGRVMTYEGAPIQAFYHSTSSGRTRPNFDGGTPLPYLSSVSGEDADSPLSRWSVHIPFGDVAVILARAGVWPGGPVGSVTARDGEVTVSNAQRRVAIPASRFRRILNTEAPCAFPGTYPPARADGGRLPSTVPQARYSLAAEPGGIVVFGRGWGHDVGMSQYGARSLAARGRSAADILSHFYAGLRPVAVDEPYSIRVLVAEGVTSVLITPEKGGDVAGTTTVSGEAYEVAPTSDGPRVLRTKPLAPKPQFEITDRGIRRIDASEPAPGFVQRIRLSNPARVAVTLTRGDGAILRKPELSYDRGERDLMIEWPVPPSGASYRAVIEAFDGLDRVRLETSFTMPPAHMVAQAPSPTAENSRRPLWPVGAALGLVLILGISLVRGMRRSGA